MKVLHLGAGNLYGGIETLFTTMARCRQLCPEMEPEFALCFRGRVWDELEATGVPVHDLGAVRFSRPWTVWKARRRLHQVLAETQPSVIVTHGSWPHSLFAPVARQSGATVCFFAHNPTMGRHWLERWARRTPPDRVIANSHFTAVSMPSQFPDVPVDVWYLPVSHGEPAAGREVRTELGTSVDAVVVLQACRMERWKGQLILIQALTQLKDQPGWECWIAGGVQKADETEFLLELQAEAKRGGIAERVRFLGQRSDVARLMAAADIYCQPNTGPEPFGISFVEALRARLPVVTSACGGGAEIVTPKCGVLTPPGDAGAVADALAGLVADRARREALGSAGLVRADELCNPARQLATFAKVVG